MTQDWRYWLYFQLAWTLLTSLQQIARQKHSFLILMQSHILYWSYVLKFF